MAELKTYDVVVNGWATTVQLTDADARARGLLVDEPEEAAAPTSKARRPANKGRTVADKGA